MRLYDQQFDRFLCYLDPITYSQVISYYDMKPDIIKSLVYQFGTTILKMRFPGDTQYNQFKQQDELEKLLNSLELQTVDQQKLFEVINSSLLFYEEQRIDFIGIYELFQEVMQFVLDGYGSYKFTNGKVLTGNFTNGKLEGMGKLENKVSGDVYEGMFVNGLFQGEGKQNLFNGEVYEGDFFNNKRHGQGTLKRNNGIQYMGDFQNGKYHGQGTIIYPDGRKIKGRFEFNKIQEVLEEILPNKNQLKIN